MVVLDSLNAIKGYRYELWCLARGMGTRYCMVNVDSPPEQCRRWNQQRSGDGYSAAVFDDLARRFERPDARNKWDSPLFTVRPELGAAHVAQQVEAVVAAAMQGPAAAVAATGAAPAGSSGAAAAGRLIPTCATTNPSLACELTSTQLLLSLPFRCVATCSSMLVQTRHTFRVWFLSYSHLKSYPSADASRRTAATNLLYELDRAAQEVVERVTEAQVAAGVPGEVSFGDDIPVLRLHRVVSRKPAAWSLVCSALCCALRMGGCMCIWTAKL